MSSTVTVELQRRGPDGQPVPWQVNADGTSPVADQQAHTRLGELLAVVQGLGVADMAVLLGDVLARLHATLPVEVANPPADYPLPEGQLAGLLGALGGQATEQTLAAVLARLEEGIVVSSGIVTGSLVGPTSYPTGGFAVTLPLATVDFFQLVPLAAGGLPPCLYEVALNTPEMGQVRVRVLRTRYDRLSTVGNVSGPPAGVTVLSASGGEAAAVNAIGGNGNALRVDRLYQHGHSVSQSQTDAASVELAAGTNLSATTWRWMAVGS